MCTNKCRKDSCGRSSNRLKSSVTRPASAGPQGFGLRVHPMTTGSYDRKELRALITQFCVGLSLGSKHSKPPSRASGSILWRNDVGSPNKGVGIWGCSVGVHHSSAKTQAKKSSNIVDYCWSCSPGLHVIHDSAFDHAFYRLIRNCSADALQFHLGP